MNAFLINIKGNNDSFKAYINYHTIKENNFACNVKDYNYAKKIEASNKK